MEMQKGSNKGGGRRGDGWDKREEEVVGGIMCVCVWMCIWLIYLKRE